MDKLTAVGAAESAPAGAPAEDEIEITPEMIEAGLDELSPKTVVDLYESWANPVTVIRAIYVAMLQASR